jgi:hypothetical protein
MKKLFSLSLLAVALGAPLLLAAPAGAVSSPAPYQEVAQAGPESQARPQQRQRRQAARTPRRQRQAAQAPRGQRQAAAARSPRQAAQPARRASARQG